jgi:hypothetical protein
MSDDEEFGDFEGLDSATTKLPDNANTTTELPPMTDDPFSGLDNASHRHNMDAAITDNKNESVILNAPLDNEFDAFALAETTEDPEKHHASLEEKGTVNGFQDNTFGRHDDRSMDFFDSHVDPFPTINNETVGSAALNDFGEFDSAPPLLLATSTGSIDVVSDSNIALHEETENGTAINEQVNDTTSSAFDVDDDVGDFDDAQQTLSETTRLSDSQDACVDAWNATDGLTKQQSDPMTTSPLDANDFEEFETIPATLSEISTGGSVAVVSDSPNGQDNDAQVDAGDQGDAAVDAVEQEIQINTEAAMYTIKNDAFGDSGGTSVERTVDESIERTVDESIDVLCETMLLNVDDKSFVEDEVSIDQEHVVVDALVSVSRQDSQQNDTGVVLHAEDDVGESVGSQAGRATNGSVDANADSLDVVGPINNSSLENDNDAQSGEADTFSIKAATGSQTGVELDSRNEMDYFGDLSNAEANDTGFSDIDNFAPEPIPAIATVSTDEFGDFDNATGVHYAANGMSMHDHASQRTASPAVDFGSQQHEAVDKPDDDDFGDFEKVCFGEDESEKEDMAAEKKDTNKFLCADVEEDTQESPDDSEMPYEADVVQRLAVGNDDSFDDDDFGDFDTAPSAPEAATESIPVENDFGDFDAANEQPNDAGMLVVDAGGDEDFGNFDTAPNDAHDLTMNETSQLTAPTTSMSDPIIQKADEMLKILFKKDPSPAPMPNETTFDLSEKPTIQSILVCDCKLYYL